MLMIVLGGVLWVKVLDWVSNVLIYIVYLYIWAYIGLIVLAENTFYGYATVYMHLYIL